MKRRIGTTALSLSAFGFLFVQQQPPPIPVPGGLQPDGIFPKELVHYEQFPWRVGCVTPTLKRAYSYNSGDNKLVSQWGERDDAGEWYVRQTTEGTSFLITAVAAREGADVLFVSGVQDDGQMVLEQWQYPIRQGGRAVMGTTGAPLEVGNPMPPFAATEVVNGEAFVPPARGSHEPAVRTTLYTGSAMGHLRSMAADPEGRFILALTYPGQKIVRISLLSDPVSHTVLYAPSDIPRLVYGRAIRVLKHHMNGRTFVVSESTHDPAAKITLLVDSNNDGVIDSVEEIPPTAWGTGSEYIDYFNLEVTYNWDQ